jgi:membrane-bound lytic murein transglycosylase B
VAKARTNQPEFTQTFATYVGRALAPTRLARGQEKVAENQAILTQIISQTGVPGGVLVALWGLESNYGTQAGNTPIIPALVSLAYSSNRPEYFRKEVFAALQVADKFKLNPRTWVGSWAGASGGPQFMPSNVLAHARDGNGDGKIDLWSQNNPADVLASAANLLRVKGWQPGQPWRVQAPSELKLGGVELNDRGLSEPLTAALWAKRGVLQTTFQPEDKLRYYRPQPGGPAWLVGPNFQALLNWNNSSYFAFSALTLADTLAATVSRNTPEAR